MATQDESCLSFPALTALPYDRIEVTETSLRCDFWDNPSEFASFIGIKSDPIQYHEYSRAVLAFLARLKEEGKSRNKNVFVTFHADTTPIVSVLRVQCFEFYATADGDLMTYVWKVDPSVKWNPCFTSICGTGIIFQNGDKVLVERLGSQWSFPGSAVKAGDGIDTTVDAIIHRIFAEPQDVSKLMWDNELIFVAGYFEEKARNWGTSRNPIYANDTFLVNKLDVSSLPEADLATVDPDRFTWVDPQEIPLSIKYYNICRAAAYKLIKMGSTTEAPEDTIWEFLHTRTKTYF